MKLIIDIPEELKRYADKSTKGDCHFSAIEEAANGSMALLAIAIGAPIRWIPVSERLPEKNVEVLITTEWDCVTIGERFSNNNWFIHEGATNASTDEIVAWMPLPEPYKIESEG